MKALLAIFAFTLALSAQAQAPSSKIQTRLCGDSLREVAQIINQQFKDLEPSDLVSCFKGDWGYGLVIDIDKSLNLGGTAFEACPQNSGAIFLRKKGTNNGGMLVCRDGLMKASGFSGELVMANGRWTKQGTVVAGGNRRNQN